MPAVTNDVNAPRDASTFYAAPPSNTLEGWAFAYLSSATLSEKFTLADAPRALEIGAPRREVARPGRPPELVAQQSRRKTPSPEALRAPRRRAELMHTFLHHELQAAELFCWAILAYPEAPEAFRRGLAGIARDEVRHMALYREYLSNLDFAFGDFPVRDWFWERVPSATHPLAFVATLGMGFEGGNLDHTRRFAAHLRSIGDDEGARLQETIFEEEVPHVRFALHWFQRWTDECEFGTWLRHLPAPLSPVLMKGEPFERAGRLRSGFPERFLAELQAWPDVRSGRRDVTDG
jgi:uncharacterized ferritin-like protein (DUF455 family)